MAIQVATGKVRAVQPGAGRRKAPLFPKGRVLRQEDSTRLAALLASKFGQSPPERPLRWSRVLLLWDAGMSYPEIAEQTGLAVGAVGTTLARARKRLVTAHATIEVVRVGEIEALRAAAVG